VRIRRGSLAGLEGILLNKKESLRVIISVELIMRSVSVEVSAGDIEPL
jgi:NADH:ubiquinone oxidoreductase subunit K